MDESFKIFIDRLRHGESEKINEVFSPSFFDLHEIDLAFEQPVYVQGEAYLAEDNLIMHLKIKTQATMPCAICNEPTQVTIEIPNFYHALSLSEVKGGVFNYGELLRETVLLELPKTIECHQGHCPERTELLKFISKKTSKETETHKPFADL